MHLTLTPAYGRDYKNKREVVQAFSEGKDFIIATPFHPDSGRYCNNQDFKGSNYSIVIRYKKLTQLAVIKN